MMLQVISSRLKLEHRVSLFQQETEHQQGLIKYVCQLNINETEWNPAAQQMAKYNQMVKEVTRHTSPGVFTLIVKYQQCSHLLSTLEPVYITALIRW